MEPGSRGADQKDKQVAAQDTAVSENNFHHDSDPAPGDRGTGSLGCVLNSAGHDPERPDLTLGLAFFREGAGPKDLQQPLPTSTTQ